MSTPNTHRLLLSGHKPTFELFEFDSSTRSLRCLAKPDAPPSTTWLERSPTVTNLVYGSSETEHEVYSMMVEKDGLEVTSKRATGCTWPVHFAIARDGSALITGGLGSGETVYIPLEPDGTLSQSSPSPLLTYPDPHPYSDEGDKALFGKRQKGPHVHGLDVDSKGTVYICDLGSDALWKAEREGESGLKVTGKFESEKGFTPRHSILSPDEKLLYVNSELQGQLLICDTTTLRRLSSTYITPPRLSRSVRDLLLTAELYAHPIHRRTLYISLRGSRRMGDMSPYRGIPNPSPPADEMPKDKGDSIAIVLLNHDGSGVEEVRHFQTGLDWPRGMRVSDDGQILAVAGEFGGALEVYKISGERGEEFELVAKDESVKDVNCVLWL